MSYYELIRHDVQYEKKIKSPVLPESMQTQNNVI